jgi:Caspase domain
MQEQNILTQTNGLPRIYALLIGIDLYLPNALPDGSSYASLGGCVRDITQVEDFLKSSLQLPDHSIIKLTASNNGAAEPLEPHEQWPTYENMVAAFRKVTELAQKGDQVYIHYSGQEGVLNRPCCQNRRERMASMRRSSLQI